MKHKQSLFLRRSLKESTLETKLLRNNLRAAKRMFGSPLAPRIIVHLKTLSRNYGFSFEAGELQIIDGSWYVRHTGLLRLARRKRCCGIHVEAVDSVCDFAANRFVLKATVYPSKDSAGFVGYGDADPSNASLLVRGAEMRIAEIRAVNRALPSLLIPFPLGLRFSFGIRKRSGSSSTCVKARSRRNSICWFVERCSRFASSPILAFRLARIRISTGTRSSFIGKFTKNFSCCRDSVLIS